MGYHLIERKKYRAVNKFCVCLSFRCDLFFICRPRFYLPAYTIGCMQEKGNLAALLYFCIPSIFYTIIWGMVK